MCIHAKPKTAARDCHCWKDEHRIKKKSGKQKKWDQEGERWSRDSQRERKKKSRTLCGLQKLLRRRALRKWNQSAPNNCNHHWERLNWDEDNDHWLTDDRVWGERKGPVWEAPVSFFLSLALRKLLLSVWVSVKVKAHHWYFFIILSALGASFSGLQIAGQKAEKGKRGEL